jgi:hypothetical protein
LKESVDESLIGGMILLVGDRKIDTSIAKELRQLETQFLDRASRESQNDEAYFVESSSE